MALQLELAPEGIDDDPRWTIHTEVFDGPLDLLLYLVKRDGIDLLQLPVARIADSYLSYLDRLRALNLSIAADYLVMAATLVHLKSLELLPRPPTPVEEDDVDPREELVRRLREHARIAAAADQLAERPMLGEQVHAREPLDLGERDVPLTTNFDVYALLDTYYRMLEVRDAPPSRVKFVSAGPDLGMCVRRLLDALGDVGGRAELGALLASLPTRADRVVTFLASLEMARLQWLTLVQTSHLGPVEVTRRVPEEEVDLSMVVGFDPPDADPDGQMGLPLGEG